MHVGFFSGGFLQYSATETTEQFFDSFTHTEFESETQKQGIKQGSFMGTYLFYLIIVPNLCVRLIQ